MSSRFTLPSVALLGASLVLSAAFYAGVARADGDPDFHVTVKDIRHNVVHSTNGNCVLTRKIADNNQTDCGRSQEMMTAEEIRRTVGLEERTVYFNFNDSSLTPAAQAKLDSLLNVLKSDKQIENVSIVGFADRIGSVPYNEALSRRRAITVKDYLAAHGYNNAEVTKTRWVGKSRPSVVCAGEAKKSALITCLSPDRKVEVEVNYVGSKVYYRKTGVMRPAYRIRKVRPVHTQPTVVIPSGQ